MNKLERMLDLRRRNAELLTTLVSSVAHDNGIVLPKEVQDKKLNWYLYTIAFKKDNLRDMVQKKMVKDRVGVTVYYDPPVHKTPYYEKILASTASSSQSSSRDLSNTDWASKHVLSLPTHPLVTQEEVERVAQSIKSAI
jgi:dTDP-4-amino-4,6-dideoxygalactose transaminase